MLSDTRQSGLAVQPISIMEMKAYMELFDYLGDKGQFVECIIALDSVFLKKAREKNDN